MKTPKDYVKNLKNGIITDQMISDVLYSYSKRAKNYRDKARELRNFIKKNHRWLFWITFDPADSVEINEFRKDVLYERKSDILEKVEDRFLKCIHKQDKHATRRIYDYDSRFESVCNSDEVVWSNCYYDREEDREVYFVDIPSKERQFLYFKFYEFPDRSFHSPITEEEAMKYAENKKLEIIEIDDLVTYGEDTDLLLSLQFCDKVYRFLFPDKTIYKISQPVCVNSYFDGTDCRFYTDEEIRMYREEKEQKRKQAEIDRERRKEERKKEREEQRRLKKIEDARHKDELKQLLVQNKESDWNNISGCLYSHKDPIFEKFFKKLPEEQKNKIVDSLWNSLYSKIDTSEYNVVKNDIENCPDKPKRIIECVMDYITSERALSSFYQESQLKDMLIQKKTQYFVDMVNSMIDYNNGLTRDNGKIHFIKYQKLGLCFCNVPLFGNIYDKTFSDDSKRLFEGVFKGMSDKKEFNRTYQSMFTIQQRMHNRCNVGYKKFKAELDRLIKDNNKANGQLD